MHFRAARKRNGSLLDITPIVDTVFNLLIFFALSLNFVSTPGIKVNLPSSTAQELPQDRKDLRVVIRPSGELFLGEVRIDLKGLAARFRETAAKHADAQVLIQADEKVPHGKVVEVMDLARRAGLYKLGIVTRPKREES